MEIHRRNFPEVIRDNDEIYFQHVIGIIESVDELCSLEITKLPDSYHFRIAPSVPRYTNHILKEIIKFNNLYGIFMDMGKSIRTSSTITFDIKTSE